MKKRYNVGGFTLTEVSVALGIFSIIVIGVIGTFLAFLPKVQDVSIEKELSNDLEFIYNLIENKIKEADLIEEPILRTTSSKLILKYTDPTRNPTIFSAIDGDLYLEEGSGLSYTKKKINPDYFIVESVNFTNISGDFNDKDIKIDIKISFKKDNKTVESSQTYSSFPEGEAIIVTSSPPIISFSANPNIIIEGNNSTLTWTSQYADSCEASGGWTGQKPTSGTQKVNPTVTTTYILSCSGAGGSSVESVSVTVIPKLTVSCSVSPNPALVNQPVNFSAQASGGTGSYTYSWSGACTSTNKTCSKTFPEPNTYSATLTVTSGTQQVNTTCQVKVEALSPTLSFNANPQHILLGESSTLSWTSTNTNYCEASGGWSGVRPPVGETIVSPRKSTTYTLTCYGVRGNISKSVTVRVFYEGDFCRPFIRCECVDIPCDYIPPPGGGGGGGGSVIGYMIISGSNKHIEDLKSGDIIYGEKNSQIIKQKVEQVWSKEPSILTIYRIEGDDFAVELTGNHLVWVNGKWLPSRDIVRGDFLTILDSKNNKIKLSKVTNISKRKIWTRTYTLKTELGHYFAGKVMVKNSLALKMP